MGGGARESVTGQVSASVRVDRARGADVPAIVDIERQSFTDPWSERSFRDLLAHPRIFFACARSLDHDGRSSVERVVGYVVAWFAAGEGEIANLAVAPDARGLRIGARLLEAALEESRRVGTLDMFLEVRSTNVRARQLYESHGFVEVGRRKNYYRRPTEDAVILRRSEGVAVQPKSEV